LLTGGFGDIPPMDQVLQEGDARHHRAGQIPERHLPVALEDTFRGDRDQQLLPPLP
jgi:hypothetical protein